MIPGEEINLGNLNSLIERHMPFLIRTVSNFTGRYISVENDEEFSIGLLAFAEAVKRYEPDRGNFLSFAKLVMESRLKNYVEKKNAHMKEESLEALQETGIDFSQREDEENEETEKLHEEIIKYREELLLFDLTLEKLADTSPKHRDTRRTAVQTAETASRDPETVEETYRKRKLPVRKVARLGKVTEKVVKNSKTFILAVMIIFVREFTGLRYWIKGTR
ncbi:MAG: RNA polymerase subunit sigma [Clostridiales bacterium]|nr:RNA polymerase subunit sigma [Clostridiales bacterium]